MFVKQGMVPTKEIFEEAINNNKIVTWLLHFLGLLVMWLGNDSMPHMFEVFMDVIPCLG